MMNDASIRSSRTPITARAGWALLCAILAACAFGPKKPALETLRAEHSSFIQGPVGLLHVSDGGDMASPLPPVIFLHGLGGDVEIWRAQLDHLRETRRAIAFDARGHGQSARALPADYTVEGLADDIDAVARALHLTRFILVGHSISGCALQAYAMKHGDTLLGLVFADAIGDFSRAGTPAEILAFIQSDVALGGDLAKEAALFEEMLGPPARAATKTAVLKSFANLDPKAFAPLRASMARFIPPQDLAKSRAPLLAIEAADNNFPVRFSSLVPAAPRAALASVSHWLMLDDPEAFNRALDGFLMPVPRLQPPYNSDNPSAK